VVETQCYFETGSMTRPNKLCHKLFVLCIIVFFLASLRIHAQFYNLPNEFSFSLLTEKKLSGKDSSVHAGIKPYIPFFSDKYYHVADTHKIFKYITDDPALDVVFFKHLITIKPREEKFRFTIDPLLNVDIGNSYDVIKRQTSTNTRGFIATGNIGKKFYFESMFAESQSFFPQYMTDAVNAISVVPGQGRFKKFKETGFDYAFSSGFVSYQPFKNLNIQAGHGKQKIGYGYRSLLLSDNSFNYPYARITQQWFKGRLQYTNIYAALMNLEAASVKQNPNAERLFQKKAAAFQYLSLNIGKFLNLGFFQGMIWQAGDSKNRQHLEWQYFNPIIYSQVAQYGLNNTNNIVAGGDIRIKITNKLNLYGQLMLDDLSHMRSLGEGYGYQAGFYYFDAFGLKNLTLQAEYNNVTEGSYLAPATVTINQSYSHYHQNLAYTPGYGQETSFMADYKYKRAFINVRYHYQVVPLSGDYYYDTQIGNLKIGYLINPSYNLNVALGITYRNQNFPNFSKLDNQTNYFYLGVRTSFYNLYYDF
jgi:hypothetical protein